MKYYTVAAFFLVLIVAGCSTKPVLISKSADVPAGVNLSGQWLLRETSGETPREARESLVHVFLETGKSIKITQTDSGLFISFDRSVVEEYRFGENREISIGEITASRASGWEGSAYVIETLDRDGAQLTDSYRLANGRKELLRSISIEIRDRNKLSLTQVFDRT